MLSQALIDYAGNKTGLFNRLVEIHNIAYNAGDDVVYPANQVFNIEVTLINSDNAKTIKLTPNTNFNGCTFNVKNVTGVTATLFTLSTPNSQVHSVTITKNLLTYGAYVTGSGGEMDSHTKLLVVKDQNLWTTRTEGEDPYFYRRDILLVVNNIVQNNPISTYNNAASSPSCTYFDVTESQKTICNATINRTFDSTSVTRVLLLHRQYNVSVENIEVNTPTPVTLLNDEMFMVIDSAKISFTDISITNTYSDINNWGYGFYMNNVWDSSFEGLTATAVWGIFGTKNINVVSLADCDINRFDIHCYGRDVTCEGCTFHNNNREHTFNRFSSLFGTLMYNSCIFYMFRPIKIDHNYNAYTPFDLVINDCTVTIPADNNYLFEIPHFRNDINSRPELQEKCLPNIDISNLAMNVVSGVTNFYFMKFYDFTYTGSFHYMSDFIADVYPYTQQSPDYVNFYASSHPITLASTLNVSLSRRATPTIMNIT